MPRFALKSCVPQLGPFVSLENSSGLTVHPSSYGTGLILANPVSLYNRYSEIWKLGSVFRNWDLHAIVVCTRKFKSLWLLEKESKTQLKLMLCALIIHTPQGRGITAARIKVFLRHL